jgi:hypothetical protein
MSSQYYKGLLKTAKGNLSDYKKRMGQLEIIRDNYSILDSYATDLNKCCSTTLSNSYSGIKVSGGSNDASLVFGKQDSGSGDNNLSSSRSYINAEIRRVQDKIDELERNINSYNTSITQEERKEKEAAEKAKSQNC